MRWYQPILLAAPVVLCSALLVRPGVATAGVEPSPFQPEINQLGAAENILESAEARIVKSMDHPPDPVVPSPNLNGALNRLDAINRQLVSVDDMVRSVVEEVMGFDPTPFQPVSDIVPPLVGLNSAAQRIVDEIEARLGLDPISFVPEYASALLVVQGSAQIISTHTQGYIDQITCDVSCPEIVSAAQCNAYVCCVWIATDNPDVGWCDYDPDYPPEE